MTDIPHSKVQLSLACNQLIKLDTFSLSDPFVVVYEVSANGTRTELGRTERIKNTREPRFTKSFSITYYFERVQRMIFEVYDADGKETGSLAKHDLIGHVETTLASIMSAPSATFTAPIENSKHPQRKNGNLVVKGEEVAMNAHLVTMVCAGKGLDKKDFFGKSDLYFIIYRYSSSGSREKAYTSETIMKTLDPTWKMLSIDTNALAFGDFDRKLEVEVYDWDSNSAHDLIGVFTTTLREIEGGKRSFDIINPKKTSKKGYTNSGVFEIITFKLERQYSFLDYLSSGLELNLVVAIDFTGSNGQVTDPSSLHYLQGPPNQYIQAIRAVGSVLEYYDADKLFPVYGFGAKMPDGSVSHDFNVTLHQNAFVAGVEGIVQAYFQCVQRVQLWGPTNFAPIINKTAGLARYAQKEANNQKYFVLLILTDGEVTDMANTMTAIANATELPLSIVIVGVGNADFGKMERLDGDDKPVGRRDIVQFVAFRDVAHDREKLAEQVLAEIPGQVVQYMRSQHITPKRTA